MEKVTCLQKYISPMFVQMLQHLVSNWKETFVIAISKMNWHCLSIVSAKLLSTHVLSQVNL